MNGRAVPVVVGTLGASAPSAIRAQQLAGGALSGSALLSISPGSVGGRRRASSVVTALPVTPYDHAARATLGRLRRQPRRPRRPGLRVGRGSGTFLNSVSSSRFRLGSQERAPRECPSRTLLGPDVREGPVREHPQQRRERHVRSTPEPRVVNRTREGCLAPPQKIDCLNPAPRCAKHIYCSAYRPAPYEVAPAGKALTRGPAVRGAVRWQQPSLPI